MIETTLVIAGAYPPSEDDDRERARAQDVLRESADLRDAARRSASDVLVVHTSG